MGRLIAAGANVDTVTTGDGGTPLIFAAKDGHDAVVGQLIAAGTVVDKAMTYDGTTPLLTAAHDRDTIGSPRQFTRLTRVCTSTTGTAKGTAAEHESTLTGKGGIRKAVREDRPGGNLHPKFGMSVEHQVGNTGCLTACFAALQHDLRGLRLRAHRRQQS